MMVFSAIFGGFFKNWQKRIKLKFKTLNINISLGGKYIRIRKCSDSSILRFSMENLRWWLPNTLHFNSQYPITNSQFERSHSTRCLCGNPKKTLCLENKAKFLLHNISKIKVFFILLVFLFLVLYTKYYIIFSII